MLVDVSIDNINTNLKQAGIEIPDEEIFQTFLAFSENRPYSSKYTEAVARRNKNIFQGGTTRKQVTEVSDYDKLQTFMEFVD